MLIVRSAPAWASLLQNVARLQGLSSLDRAAAGRHVERALNLTSGVEDIVKLVGVKGDLVGGRAATVSRPISTPPNG